MLKVCKSKCDQCLFSKKMIVPIKRKMQIIKDCVRNQQHFMCHKSTDVVCGGFYKEMGEVSQGIRIAQRLRVIEFVEPLKEISRASLEKEDEEMGD